MGGLRLPLSFVLVSGAVSSPCLYLRHENLKLQFHVVLLLQMSFCCPLATGFQRLTFFEVGVPFLAGQSSIGQEKSFLDSSYWSEVFGLLLSTGMDKQPQEVTKWLCRVTDVFSLSCTDVNLSFVNE